MSAETEQYRERLARTHWSEIYQHVPWELTTMETREDVLKGASAVAAQVLRDLMESFPKNEPLYHGWGDEVDIRDRIVIFAAERGIDLDGGAS